jgi:5-methylcytosine-specific restriction protein B
VWWVVANPKQWHWDSLFRDGRVDYKYGRIKRNYPLVQPGDLVVGYLAAPEKRIYALARVAEGLHDKEGKPCITLEPVQRIENGLTYAELMEDPTLSQSEPLYNRCQGTLFRLEEREADRLWGLLADENPQLAEYIDQEETQADTQSPLTLITFHPSYSYEDFIEGFRPEDTGEGLRLRLSDGLFKRICATAQADPNRKYLILIDEINRANLAKVFGEIITLLERDKRGIQLVLPQSKTPFSVPRNVYILGTINTADRSIRLMDAALRRRFGFIELLPELALLRDIQIDGLLDLYDFLSVLNARIRRMQGREKEIGQGFFFNDGQLVSDGMGFARCFRQDILPLLQEYCYDDYSELAQYIGRELVDVENGTIRPNILHDDEKLVAALAEFTSAAAGSA